MAIPPGGQAAVHRFLVLAALASCFVGNLPAIAADAVTLTIRDHRFVPDEIRVPAGQRFRIEVTNLDATPEEFESSDMKFEKIVVPGGKITVNAGPLKPGSYKFFGDYHPDLAHGTIIAVTE